MEAEVVSQQEIDSFLSRYKRWRQQDNSLVCSVQFQDFLEAFGHMTRGALISERLNHHPEWTNVYSRLEISLSTHDAGGITTKDLRWIEAFDASLETVD